MAKMASGLPSNTDEQTPTLLPIVDLSAPIDQVANELRMALSTSGFVYCSNHKKDKEIDTAFQAIKSFFHMSLEKKNKACSVNRALRGYSPAYTENFASLYGVRGPNDCVEKFRIGPLDLDVKDRPRAQKPFYFPNTWPEECSESAEDGESQSPPTAEDGEAENGRNVHSDCCGESSSSSIDNSEGRNSRAKSPSIHFDAVEFQNALENMYTAMRELSELIAIALAISLDLPPDYFRAQMKHPTSILSGNRYLPHHSSSLMWDHETNIAAHTDVSLFTIVCQQPYPVSLDTNKRLEFEEYSGGLQVKLGVGGEQEEVWVNVDPKPHAVVINIGDCLSDWSGGRLKSTVHRVIPLKRRLVPNKGDSLQAGEYEEIERFSFAFFCTPDPDTNVHPGSLLVHHHDKKATQLEGSDGKDNGVADLGHLLLYSKWRKDRVSRAMSMLKNKT
jgi:isopenicillin N synthase-like dioxygenase